jgi:phosphoribosylformimino-5-aminoimidazole carboxamide ribotide isomerase
MQIVPVIDLKGGAVVRAFRGERAAYAPIDTPLAVSSAPRDVVSGFLRLQAFPAIYIADLDAIDGRSNGHAETIAELALEFSGVRFWVDAGVADAARLGHLRDAGVDPVLGSESLSSSEILRDLRDDPRAILSLDFRGEDFLGPRDLLGAPELWPGRVIAMTLARVGAFQGPDVALLARLTEQAKGRAIYAAGGVRDARDLAALARIGVAGALVASALHDGRLTRGDLELCAPAQK